MPAYSSLEDLLSAQSTALIAAPGHLLARAVPWVSYRSDALCRFSLCRRRKLANYAFRAVLDAVMGPLEFDIALLPAPPIGQRRSSKTVLESRRSQAHE